MNRIIKWRWGLLALWLVATVLLAAFQPDINAILRQRGQNPLTADSPSVVAAGLLQELSGSTTGASNIIVFHNPDKLTDTDMSQIEQGIANITAHQSELGVDQILDPFSIPDAKSSLISEDNTTLMVSFNLDRLGREVEDIQHELETALKDVHTPFYLTGEDFIQNDYIRASETGVEKSALLTVGFILLVLIVMFRSVVIPIVSLLVVGITYLVSMGIAAQIIDKLNFPITSVTQMLLVLILFGIGTDYNILLFNRFKEELGHGRTTDEAIIVTYQTAGKTIFYSILTVLIAFAGLSFSTFGIYKSANVVAIGTAVLLIQIWTLTPFFMKTVGTKLFWPSKKAGGHKESKFWAKLTAISVKNPIVVTAVIVLLMIPVMMNSGQKLSFDQLKELGDDYASTKGFNIAAERFSRGQALPTTVLLKNDEPLDNNDSLAVIDKLTDTLKGIQGVNKVASVTQPESQPIEQFYISSQTESVAEGINATKDGVDKIQDGIQQMHDKLVSPDFSDVNKLASGTGEIHSGYTQITTALGQVSDGISQGASGADQLKAGITKLKQGLTTVSGHTNELSQGLTQMQQGYVSIADGYGQLQNKLPEIKQGLAGMNGLIGSLGARYTELQTDQEFTTLKQTGISLETGIAQMTGGMQALQTNYTQLNASFGEATKGLKQIASAQAEMAKGLTQLETGAKSLTDGLRKGASGNREIATNMKKLNDALKTVQEGQQQLGDGLGSLSDGMVQLKDGLGKSGNGLGDISDGLGKTSDFITELNSSKTFFIPREALTSNDFGKAMDNFMSADRKIVKWIVVLDEDPYSPAALDTIERINNAVDNTLNGTILAKAQHGATGPSSTTYDTNKAQVESFNSTAIIVIIGVFLVLLLVIRKFWPAVYIILALLASYYVAMLASNYVTEHIIKADGVSSFVPFFSFIVIVAVGVDYSIFLMMRYKEYENEAPGVAIVEAAKHVGGVVISAMVILGGTFATLMPSGLVLLIELAVAVIVGLVVLCFVLLPMLLPALLVLPNAFKRKDATQKKESYQNSFEA